MGNLTKISNEGESDLSFAYTYDRNGRILEEIRTEDGQSLISRYGYNEAGMLEDFSRSDGYEESYTYDAAGNMTVRKVNGLELTMEYNQAGQMISMHSENGIIRYQYDEDGNLVRKESAAGTDTYTYDVWGQLTRYEGYDGYKERYSYLSVGMLYEKEASSDGKRLTQEEILEGKTLEEKYPDGQESGKSYASETILTKYVYL